MGEEREGRGEGGLQPVGLPCSITDLSASDRCASSVFSSTLCSHSFVCVCVCIIHVFVCVTVCVCVYNSCVCMCVCMYRVCLCVCV